MNDRYARQKDLVDSKIFTTPICIVGVGAVGSFTALTLAKMGFQKIAVYDPDIVSEVNLPNQFYRECDVSPTFKYGRKKVFALHDIIQLFTGTKIFPIAREFNYINNQDMAKFLKKGILISAVDSMTVRKDLWQLFFKPQAKKLQLQGFIDGRMGRHQAEVYVVKTTSNSDVKSYCDTLHDNDKIDHLRCTEKAIIYNVLFIASMICNQVKLLLEGKLYKHKIITDLENMEILIQGGNK